MGSATLGSVSAKSTFFQLKAELAATTAITLRQNTFELFNSGNVWSVAANVTSIYQRRRLSTRSASTVTTMPLRTKEQKNVSRVYFCTPEIVSMFVLAFGFIPCS